MICLRFQVNDARLNSRVNSLPLRPRTISFEGIKSWVNSVHIGSDTSCSFFPLLLYSACIYASLFFSTLFFLLYFLHPSDSFPFSSLLFSCSLFKCTCPKFNCNSLYRTSWQGVKSWVNSVHTGSDTSCSFSWYGISWEGFKSWANSVLIDSDTSCSSSLFLPTLLVYIFVPSLFNSLVSPLPFPSFWFSPFLFSTIFMFSLSAIARSLTVIVGIGSLEKDIKSWVNSVHTGSDTSCSFSWYRSSWQGVKFWVNSVHTGSDTSCSFSWYGISWEGIKSWDNSVLIDSDTSCSSSLFLPTLLVYIRPFSFQLSCFSITFSFLLILSLSLLYSFHVVSLSAIARSLTVIVDLGSLEKDIKSWVHSVHIGSDTSCSLFPLLLYSACIYAFLLFSTLLFLLYLLHPSDSFLFSSLLVSCSVSKCTCPKFNCNSYDIGSLLRESNLEFILSLLTDTSCSFFPLLAYPACIYIRPFSFQLSCFSFTFSILLILSFSLLYSFHVVSLSALARSLTVIVMI